MTLLPAQLGMWRRGLSKFFCNQQSENAGHGGHIKSWKQQRQTRMATFKIRRKETTARGKRVPGTTVSWAPWHPTHHHWHVDCTLPAAVLGTKTKPEAGMLFHPKKMDLGPRTGICSLEGSHIPAENTTKAFSHFSWKKSKNENASASCNLLMDSTDKQRWKITSQGFCPFRTDRTEQHIL